MDFVHDQLATGKKLRILIVVDTHSRYCPAAGARFAYRGEDVVQTLEGICRKTGYPKTIRVDNGTPSYVLTNDRLRLRVGVFGRVLVGSIMAVSGECSPAQGFGLPYQRRHLAL